MNKYEYRMSNAALGQSFALSDIARQMGRMTDSVSYGAEKSVRVQDCLSDVDLRFIRAYLL